MNYKSGPARIAERTRLRNTNNTDIRRQHCYESRLKRYLEEKRKNREEKSNTIIPYQDVDKSRVLASRETLPSLSRRSAHKQVPVDPPGRQVVKGREAGGRGGRGKERGLSFVGLKDPERSKRPRNPL